MLAANRITEKRMVGMPRVWQARFTGCWWLVEYCAIHCSLVRPPSIAMNDTPAGWKGSRGPRASTSPRFGWRGKRKFFGGSRFSCSFGALALLIAAILRLLVRGLLLHDLMMTQIPARWWVSSGPDGRLACTAVEPAACRVVASYVLAGGTTLACTLLWFLLWAPP